LIVRFEREAKEQTPDTNKALSNDANARYPTHTPAWQSAE
jgi:hypothetical protein